MTTALLHLKLLESPGNVWALFDLFSLLEVRFSSGMSQRNVSADETSSSEIVFNHLRRFRSPSLARVQRGTMSARTAGHIR